MARGLFAIALLGAWLVACSDTPDGTSAGSTSQPAGVGETGTVNLPLTAETNGAAYRLQKAQFSISGSALANPLIVKPPADTPIDTETLPVGAFSALLKDGWVLERRGPDATAFVAVKATLITPNPVNFEVKKGGTTDVFFGFATNGGDVAIGTGTANIRISVQDCAQFNGIAASLASLTIDCTGTIGPDSYSVNTDGILSRNFDACTRDKSKLAAIDQLLSLQFRSVRLPFVKDCVAGRYAEWKASLPQRNGVTECPTWDKQGIVNEATDAQIQKLIPELVRLSQTPDDGTRPQFLQLLDQGYMFGVGFANGAPPPGSKCQTPGDCAAVCAGGFPGFVVRNDAGTVLTDGPYWLLDNSYGTAAQDPFLRANYYHPMSYYGPSPGTQWATRERFSPCPPDATGAAVACPPEMCSFGPSHIHIRLKCDCLNAANNATCPADDASCVGYCNP